MIACRRVVRNCELVLVGLFACFAWGACAPIAMALPPGLSGELLELPVKRPAVTSDLAAQSYTFGSFTAVDVRRDSLTEKTTVTIDSASSGTAVNGFRFTLEGPGGPAHRVECRLMTETRSAGEFTKSRRSMTCDVTAEGSAGWQLSVARGDKKTHKVGALRLPDAQVIELREIHESTSNATLFEPTGYEFTANGQSKGAVDVNRAAVVYMKPDLTPEGALQLACASVALLVYTDLER